MTAIDMTSVLDDLMGELFIPPGMMITPGVKGDTPERLRPRAEPRPCRSRLATLMASASLATVRGSAATTRSPHARAQRLAADGIEMSINFLSQEELTSQGRAMKRERFLLGVMAIRL
jgi:hypothetical protein